MIAGCSSSAGNCTIGAVELEFCHLQDHGIDLGGKSFREIHGLGEVLDALSNHTIHP